MSLFDKRLNETEKLKIIDILKKFDENCIDYDLICKYFSEIRNKKFNK